MDSEIVLEVKQEDTDSRLCIRYKPGEIGITETPIKAETDFITEILPTPRNYQNIGILDNMWKDTNIQTSWISLRPCLKV